MRDEFLKAAPDDKLLAEAREVWQSKAREVLTDAHPNIYRWRTDDMIIETMAAFAQAAVEREREAAIQTIKRLATFYKEECKAGDVACILLQLAADIEFEGRARASKEQP